MSLVPHPKMRWPSRRDGTLSAIGTVSRCPARRTRCSRPRWLRATTTLPSRCTLSGVLRSASSTRSVSRCSSPDTLSTSTSAAVNATGSAARSSTSGSHAVLAQDVVQRELVVLLPRLEVAQHQQAGHPELAACKRLDAARPHRDRALRDDAASELVAGLRLEDAGAAGDDRSGTEFGAPAYAGAFDHQAA